MAAAVIVRLIPKLHTVVSSESGYYIGRQLWFGLVVVYGMVLYVANIPWLSIREDFICRGNITLPCLIKCFEKRFSVPVLGTWYFFYFIFIALFCLVEVFMTQLRQKQVKVMKSMVSMISMVKNLEEGSMVTNKELGPSWTKSILNLHREKILLLLYLLYFLLQVTSQCIFLFILLFKQHPLVKQGCTHCSTISCPGPYCCLIRASVEKQMSIYILSTLSISIILLGTSFFAYSIYHYLLKGHASSKVQIS
ncbi:gap junction beta-3 [Sigmodon hispidus]